MRLPCLATAPHAPARRRAGASLPGLLVAGALATAGLLAPGCNTPLDDGDGSPDLSTAEAPDLGAAPDMADSSTRLIGFDYDVAVGGEQYLCKRVTLTEDVWVKEFIPKDDVGTHHQLLAFDPATKEPDGVSVCQLFATRNWTVVFASGVRSPSLRMPDGVGFKLPKGTQLIHQLHVFNATQSPIHASAAMNVVTIDPADVKEEAEVLLAGPLPTAQVTPAIPVGMGQVVDGKCTMRSDTKFFSVFPHMHQFGRHIAVRAVQGGVTTTVYDESYSFNDQTFRSFSGMPLVTGDRIEVTCTYDNETGAPVDFGESSTEEMCFAISYVAPKQPKSAFGSFCFQ